MLFWIEHEKSSVNSIALKVTRRQGEKKNIVAFY